MTLIQLFTNQNGRCFYCNCDMCFVDRATQKPTPNSATVEHLKDKWDTGGCKDLSDNNIVAACYQCNNSRGNVRNVAARKYYQQIINKRGLKLNASQIKSAKLFKMFGVACI